MIAWLARCAAGALLAAVLAGCGPLPTAPHPGWDQPSYLNGVTGERSGGSG